MSDPIPIRWGDAACRLVYEAVIQCLAQFDERKRTMLAAKKSLLREAFSGKL